MADVGVPEGPRALGLPAKAYLVARAVAERDAIEALLGKETAHRGGMHGTFGEAPVRDERVKNRGHRDVRVFLANFDQQRAQLGSELASTAAIGARLRAQRFEPVRLVGVVPALEGRC